MEQVQEMAKVSQLPAIASAAALEALAGIDVTPFSCPGQFGTGGVWQDHCKNPDGPP
jgi:hypothetical protein